MITAPAARSIDTTVASRAGVRPAWSTDPFSVGMSAVSMMSFTPTGTPWSGPSGRPDSRYSSAAVACARARSGSRKAQAWTSGSTASMRARHASTSCAELITPSRISRAASEAESAWRLRQIHPVVAGPGSPRPQSPYRNSGSQSVMPGQMYMKARHRSTMIMYGIMPAKIWFSVTCLGETPFR